MDKKTILHFVRKVKKLADCGVGGEAEAAKIKYKRLCEKYNLSSEDFTELAESFNRYFIIRHSFDKLLISNLICMVLQTPTFVCGESKNILRIKLTDQQYKDIADSYEYYQKMFDDYSRYLMQAIISRNAIGFVPEKSQQQDSSQTESTITNSNQQKNTPPEYDMLKLMKLAVAIESNPWKKNSDDKNLIQAGKSVSL